MDGTRQGGKYGWTDKSICDLYKCRITEGGKSWEECTPSRSDTPDSIVRAALIAALYFKTPHEMAVQVQRHAKATTLDSSVQAHSVAFASMIGAILQFDLPLEEEEGGSDMTLKTFLYQQAGKSLPFSSMISTQDYDDDYGQYSEPDSLLWYGSIATAVKEFHHTIQPPHRGVLLYGQFCAFFATLSSAYYCTARFPTSFENAVLCSVNGGGQNTMRTSLVGALLGAHVGLNGIPSRFLDGLEDSSKILDLAKQVADIAVERNSPDDQWYWPPNDDDNNNDTHLESSMNIGLLDTTFSSSSSSSESMMIPGNSGEFLRPVPRQVEGMPNFLLIFGAACCWLGFVITIWRRKQDQSRRRLQYQSIY